MKNIPCILVADAHPDICELLEKSLTAWGHQVKVAKDATSALSLVAADRVWMVIADWNLPGGGGADFCRKVKDAAIPDKRVYFLLTMQDPGAKTFFQAMDAKVDDFMVKPFSLGEARARVASAQRIFGLESDLFQKNSQLQEAHDRLHSAVEVIQRDIDAAARIQQSLLPNCPQSIYGYRFETLFIPCRIVGGDIFNFFAADETHLAFYLLDVSGHGIPAAMLSVAVSKTLTSLPYHENVLRQSMPGAGQFHASSPASVVRELDNLFQSNARVEQYFTMIYGVADRRTDTICFTQAGHPHPILMPKAGPLRLVGAGGLPVGLVPNAEFTEACIELAPGDRLVVYSDGVTDCTNPDGNRYTTDSLLGLLEKFREKDLHELMRELGKELYKFHGNDEFDDDISVMVCEREAD